MLFKVVDEDFRLFRFQKRALQVRVKIDVHDRYDYLMARCPFVVLDEI